MQHFEDIEDLTPSEAPKADFYSDFTNCPFDLVLEYVGDRQDATLDAFHTYIEEVDNLKTRKNQEWPFSYDELDPMTPSHAQEHAHKLGT